MFDLLNCDKQELGIVIYEIQMLNETFSLFNNPSLSMSYERNAFLESFLLHARNLCDFLEDKKTFADDLVISRFFNDEGKAISAIEVNIGDLKNKINKHLSHMTTIRSNEKVGWKMDLILNEINLKMFHFFKLISSRYYHSSNQKNNFIINVGNYLGI